MCRTCTTSTLGILCKYTHTSTDAHTYKNAQYRPKWHNTHYCFEPIFIKFTWLVWIHPWVKLTVFENNRLNRTTNIGDNVLQNLVLRLSFRQYGFFEEEKNLKIVFSTLFPVEIVRFTFVVRCLFLS